MPSVMFGPFRFDLGSGELYRSGIAVKLRPQPAKLLVLLVERAGELVTRDEIRRAMWGTETFVDFDQGVNFCVRQIRTALHDNADSPCYVETLPRHGYRFIAPVERAPEHPSGPPEAVPVAAIPHRLRWQPLAIGALAFVMLAVVVGSGAFRHAVAPPVPAGNPKAHEEVELGRFFLNKVSQADTFTAIEHFESAIRQDPDYAPAYAGLADSYNQLAGVFVAGKPPTNVRLLALRAATRAIQLDPDLAEAYAALSYTSLHEFDWAQAERAARRAIELNPRLARAHQTYASFLAAQRRFAEAIAAARQALELEPASLRARQILGWMLYFDRQYDAALRELRTVLQMDRTYALARFHLGEALLVSGRFEEAITALQTTADGTARAPAVLGLLAMAYNGGGHRAEAQRLAEDLEQRSKTDHVPAGALLLAYLGIDDKARAIDTLERGFVERDNYEIWIDADPLMDPLRNEPRFQALCRRVMLGTGSPPAHSLKRDAQFASSGATSAQRP